jgi:hypothetical protein
MPEPQDQRAREAAAQALEELFDRNRGSASTAEEVDAVVDAYLAAVMGRCTTNA